MASSPVVVFSPNYYQSTYPTPATYTSTTSPIPISHAYPGQTLQFNSTNKTMTTSKFGTPYNAPAYWNQTAPLTTSNTQDYPSKWHLSTRLCSDVRPRMKRQKGGVCGNINSSCGGLFDSVGACGWVNCKGCCDRDTVVPNAIIRPVLKEKKRGC